MLQRPGHDEFPAWVERLADPLRAKEAYWHLVLSGAPALPAVRAGLTHAAADVRLYCTKALDHLVDEDAFPELIRMLGDSDARVRANALHALACDRCKDNGCRPTKSMVLTPAVRLLLEDPDPHVRAHAVEVVGRYAHEDESAARSLTMAAFDDSTAAVRKKASWYAPGGPVYNRTRPTYAANTRS